MGFWADKLNGVAPRAPVPPPPMYTPPPTAPQQAPQTYVDPSTGQVYALVPQQHVPQQQQVASEPGKIHVIEALANWRGKRGQSDAQPCPSCGGPNYYSRYNPEQPSRNGPPMAQCFDCGYPIQQFGSATGTGGSMQTAQGAKAGDGQPPRAAREAAITQSGFHPETVVARVE